MQIPAPRDALGVIFGKRWNIGTLQMFPFVFSSLGMFHREHYREQTEQSRAVRRYARRITAPVLPAEALRCSGNWCRGSAAGLGYL